MHRYFLVLDKKNRLVFKKKLEKNEPQQTLSQDFQKQGYQTYVLEGKSLSAALSQKGLKIDEENAYLTKRELKDQLYFTDKWIKELLGEPDLIEQVKGQPHKIMHLYSKSRVEAVLQTSEYKMHADSVRYGREKRTALEIERKPIRIKPNAGRMGRFESPVEKKAKDRMKELVGRLRKDWDLDEYKEFFSVARVVQRKHIFFVGPTNSGKSYRGFNELVQGDSGVFLAPLRLLALEGQEEIEKRGKECSLLTGEEMELKPSSQFVASTIEMANLDKPIDCALIDEVQLILDKNRGWAWSQAIVGIPAKKVIMTGSEECLPTLKRLIEDYLGEELEVVRLDRIGKLEIIKRPMKGLSKVEPGTAIIAFSRKGVLTLKKELEDSGRKVSVLYGNLSPGVRREEARRFRGGETDILVATDCIGMGLNLPIKTVIFSETTKFDGKEVRNLTPQEFKQIGGRAGRFGKFECGYVGTVNHTGVHLLSRNFSIQQDHQLEPCVVRPTQTQLEVLRDQLDSNNIKNAISLFSQLSKSKSMIVCSDLTEMIDIAGRIEANSLLASLSFADKYLFICAPVNSTDTVMEEYLRWLVFYARGVPVVIQERQYQAYTENGSTSEDTILNHAENCVKVLTLYHWLARKKGEFFPSMDLCEVLRGRINTFIENSLKKKGLHRKCSKCSRKMPLHFSFKMCNDCYRSGKNEDCY